MKPERDITGILLAAGFSTRFGANKLLARLAGGEFVAVHAARHLIEALPGAIAVIRPDVPALEAALREAGLEVTICPEARQGMGASLAHAVRHAGPARGYVVALADMPFILPQTIRMIAERLRAGEPLVAPRYADERGHPVGFGERYIAELASLGGDQGARDILRRDPVSYVSVADPGVVQDIDVPSDLPPGG